MPFQTLTLPHVLEREVEADEGPHFEADAGHGEELGAEGGEVDVDEVGGEALEELRDEEVLVEDPRGGQGRLCRRAVNCCRK